MTDMVGDMSSSVAYPVPAVDEHGPRSILALLGMIFGLTPFTALAGVVLSVTAFFSLSTNQHRGQRHAGFGFGVGVTWLIITGFVALTLLLH